MSLGWSAMGNPKRTRLAAYAVIVTDGSLLLVRIASRSDGAGRWTLPGGGLDWGEHPDDGLLRELKEETGLTPSSFQLAGINSHVFDESDTRAGLHAIRFLYHCEAAGEPHITEVDGSVDLVRWVPMEQVSTLDTVHLVSVGLDTTGH